MWLAPLFRKHHSGDPDQPSSKFAIIAFLAVVSTISILPFIYLGIFSRYLADDYCFSRMLIEGGGFFGGLVQMYTRISDRYSTMLIIGLFEPLGKIGLQVLLVLMIVIFFAASITLLVQIRRFLGWHLQGVELVSLAASFTFISLYTAPDLFQSVLWMSGGVTYFLPLGLMIFSFAAMIGSLNLFTGKQLPIWLTFTFFLVFIFIGGFSETTTAMMLGMMLIFTAVTFWKVKSKIQRNSIFSLLISSTLGLIVAMVLMLLAPGNEYRLALMPEHPGLLELIWLSIRYALGFTYQTFTSYPLPMIFMMIISFIVAIQQPRTDFPVKQTSWLILVIPISIFLILVTICAPSAYAQSAYPENRALMSARVIVTTGLLIWSYLLGVYWRNWTEKRSLFKERQVYTISAFVLIIVCFYLINGSLQILAQVPDYKRKAVAWDKRDTEILSMVAQGQKNITIKPLDSNGRIREISSDPDNWVNRCAAVHYGVNSIVAK